MRLSVNIDHFATIREARKDKEPEPVLAALIAEQAGASGIVCHIRGDRRHITERDLELLKGTIKTTLNVEMAATKEMKNIALNIKPDIVSLVPESPEELTTEGGLNVLAHKDSLKSHIVELQKAGIIVSIFIDPEKNQISVCRDLNINRVELNTGKYAEYSQGCEKQNKALEKILMASEFAYESGLEVHAGHGLNYHNIEPVAAIPEISGFSIGFSIVARSAIVGLDTAVRDMLDLLLL